jgi:hypothetical protein
MNTGNDLCLQTVDAPLSENACGGAGAALVRRNRALPSRRMSLAYTSGFDTMPKTSAAERFLSAAWDVSDRSLRRFESILFRFCLTAVSALTFRNRLKPEKNERDEFAKKRGLLSLPFSFVRDDRHVSAPGQL